MTESSDSARLKPDPSTPPAAELRRRRRRPLCRAACACCGVLVFLALLLLVLCLILLKPRDPTTTLVSATLAGVSPRVMLPAMRVELNITLDVDLVVHNPNRVAFSHGAGRSLLSYRGTEVGEALVAPGWIPSRGSAHVYTKVTMLADRFVADPGDLVGDLIARQMELDSSTRIPGRVVLLGFIKRHVVAISDCHFVVGFPGPQVLQQQCQQETKM